VNRKNRLLLLLLMTVILIQGCSVARKAQKEKIQKYQRTLWIKKIDVYSCNKKRKIGKLDIRYISDSVMVVIVRNNAGMEGGRLYIYRDSVFAFNRVNKKYYVVELNGRKDYYGKELREIGNILLQKKYKISEKSVELQELNGKIELSIKKFKEEAKGYFVPAEFRGKLILKNGGYCFYGITDKIVTDQYVPVSMINYVNRYKRVGRINELM